MLTLGCEIIGTIMQAAAFDYGLFCAGRVVGGIGNGMVSIFPADVRSVRLLTRNAQVTSTIPTWQSECARPKQRGFLIILSGAVISFGIMIVRTNKE